MKVGITSSFDTVSPSAKVFTPIRRPRQVSRIVLTTAIFRSEAEFTGVESMSALPPKADMCAALDYVCFGPIADMRQSLNLGPAYFEATIRTPPIFRC